MPTKKTKRKSTRTTKSNLAVSISPGIIEELKEVAALENCSVSSLVQRCVQEHLPVIRSHPLEEGGYRTDMLMTRLSAAVTTADMRKCGVRPIKFEFGLGGVISVTLLQHYDAGGIPVPLEPVDIFGPPREINESGEAHSKRVEKYYAERFHFTKKDEGVANEKTEITTDEFGFTRIIHKVQPTPVKEALRKSRN